MLYGSNVIFHICFNLKIYEVTVHRGPHGSVYYNFLQSPLLKNCNCVYEYTVYVHYTIFRYNIVEIKREGNNLRTRIC